ncbi:hypothetical protein SDC9_95278 [bioreactor metagenome]|uniref:Uncharacterized protein n=1 Tax=bioreactor metagenome TaxID=1076179 RepID=A0A645ACH7_9ZZZZ
MFYSCRNKILVLRVACTAVVGVDAPCYRSLCFFNLFGSKTMLLETLGHCCYTLKGSQCVFIVLGKGSDIESCCCIVDCPENGNQGAELCLGILGRCRHPLLNHFQEHCRDHIFVDTKVALHLLRCKVGNLYHHPHRNSFGFGIGKESYYRLAVFGNGVGLPYSSVLDSRNRRKPLFDPVFNIIGINVPNNNHSLQVGTVPLVVVIYEGFAGKVVNYTHQPNHIPLGKT